MGLGLPQNSKDKENNYWRIILGVPLIYCFISIIIFLFIFKFDTAYSLYAKTENDEKTLEILRKIYDNDSAK